MEERIFTINLRREGLTTARWKKSNRASSAVRNHLRRHMKVDNIRIGDSINKEIWSRGDQKPPAKIKIKAIKIKDDDGDDLVKAEMWGHVFEEEVKEEPKEKKGKEEKTETKRDQAKEKPETSKQSKTEKTKEKTESTDK